MKSANLLFFVGLLVLSVLHLAPGEAGCLVCSQSISLQFKQSIAYPLNVRAGKKYRLKLVVKDGDVLMDETLLSKAGVLKCVDADTSVSCHFRPYKTGKVPFKVTGDSKQSTHVLWFEAE
jgi:hypothetical protein